MKQGNSRAKGSSFERDVTKLIIQAFCDKGITSADCYRTPGSGGHRFAKQLDPGDLVTSPKLRKLFPFAVECKHYKEISWRELMMPTLPPKGLIAGWWQQAKTGARDGLQPLLVFKQNNYPIMCIFRWSSNVHPVPRTVIRVKKSELVVMVRFDQLLEQLVKDLK